MRRATNVRLQTRQPYVISIHALLAESDQATNGLTNAPPQISIHALLAESDNCTSMGRPKRLYFYPRSPCGERLIMYAFKLANLMLFLSTLSLRRATVNVSASGSTKPNFYPRSPCGERRVSETLVPRQYQFLSTLSLRRATNDYERYCIRARISIHALLAESDNVRLQTRQPYAISIHALLAESDQLYINGTAETIIFLSTLSLRRATCQRIGIRVNKTQFLSTLSLRRATAKVHKTVGHFCAYETNFMGIASSC